MKTLMDEWVDKGARKWKREGMREGMREGGKQKALAIARNLRAKGMGVNDVAETTGLTVDDILRL